MNTAALERIADFEPEELVPETRRLVQLRPASSNGFITVEADVEFIHQSAAGSQRVSAAPLAVLSFRRQTEYSVATATPISSHFFTTPPESDGISRPRLPEASEASENLRKERLLAIARTDPLLFEKTAEDLQRGNLNLLSLGKVVKLGTLTVALCCIFSLGLWLTTDLMFINPFASVLILIASPFFYLMGILSAKR